MGESRRKNKNDESKEEDDEEDMERGDDRVSDGAARRIEEEESPVTSGRRAKCPFATPSYPPCRQPICIFLHPTRHNTG